MDVSVACSPHQESDGCYAWWVTASLAIVGRECVAALDADKLTHFVLGLQTPVGGLSAHPGGSAVGGGGWRALATLIRPHTCPGPVPHALWIGSARRFGDRAGRLGRGSALLFANK